MNKLVVSLSVAVCFFSILSADVIDDLEDGNNQNETGFYWYYYDNPCDTNTDITTAIIDQNGNMIMQPSKGVGYNSEYAAELSWKLGEKKTGSDGGCIPLAGIGTMMCGDNDVAGTWVATATEISFYARASSPLTIVVEITTADVKDFGYYYKKVQITGEWTKYTVKFADLIQPDWADPVSFDPVKMSKIQFAVSADNAGTPQAGSIFIDNLNINVVIPCAACEPKVYGPGQPVTGTLISDFEGEVNLTASKFKGMDWYVYSDSKGSATTKSIFTSGIKVNENDGADQLVIEPGNTNGYNNTQGLGVEFKLGDAYTLGTDIINPFVGVGLMLSNSDKVAAGTATSLTCVDASSVLGLYFDYKTEVINPKFKNITVEFYDCDSLPDGISFSAKLSATGGVWKGAKIPFENLSLPDWPDKIALLNSSQIRFDKNKLEKMQIKIQGVAGLTGKVSFDNFKFYQTVPVRYNKDVKDGASVYSRIHSKMLTITLKSLPAGNHVGIAELIGAQGRTVARKNIVLTENGSFSFDTRGLAAGVYMVRINTVYGNEKTFSFCDRVFIRF